MYSQQLVPTHYKNFQPRIGLAFSPYSLTVFRGGFLIADTMGTLGLGGNGPNGPGQNGFNPPSALASGSDRSAGLLLEYGGAVACYTVPASECWIWCW